MTNSNEAPDVNLLNQLNSLAGGEATSSAAPVAKSNVDLSNMSSEEMKQYSENIAIAADEINNENAPPTADEAVQLKTSSKDKISIDIQDP